MSHITAQQQHTANDWWVRQQQGLSADQQRLLEAWLAAEPAHQQAFDRAEQAWQLSALLADEPLLNDDIPRRQPHSALTAPLNTRPRRWSQALLLLVFCWLGVWSWNSPWMQRWQADYYTQTGERRLIQLSDGSRVELGADTALTQQFDRQRRQLTLLRGEAVFYPAPIRDGETRPFVVSAAGQQITALGTVFYVADDNDSLALGVVQHSVRLSAADTPQAGRIVGENEFGMLTDQHWYPRPAAALTEALSWQQDQLVFRRQPVAAVIERLNRYLPDTIVLLADIAADKHLSAVFQLSSATAAESDTDTTEAAPAAAILARELNLQQLSVAGTHFLF